MKNLKYHVEFDLDFKRNPYKGKLIAVEGIEASGKTTQAEIIGEILKKDYKVFQTKNPTESFVGDFIRKSLLAGKVRIPPISLQYLFGADREIQQQDIIERLKKGEIVLTDRYFWSSVAYGTADIDTDYENFANLSLTAFSLLSMYHQFIVPDITVFLDVTLDEASRRLSESQKHTEIYDNKEMNIGVKKGYDWLIKKFSKEFTIINAGKSVEQVTREILEKIKSI